MKSAELVRDASAIEYPVTRTSRVDRTQWLLFSQTLSVGYHKMSSYHYTVKFFLRFRQFDHDFHEYHVCAPRGQALRPPLFTWVNVCSV